MSGWEEGEENFIWSGGELKLAILHACDKCGKPSMVNAVLVVKTSDFELLNAMKAQADNILKKCGELSELEQNEDGAYCGACYPKE